LDSWYGNSTHTAAHRGQLVSAFVEGCRLFCQQGRLTLSKDKNTGGESDVAGAAGEKPKQNKRVVECKRSRPNASRMIAGHAGARTVGNCGDWIVAVGR
jgi:hypothetical protein